MGFSREMLEEIKKNNQTHVVERKELNELIKKAQKVYQENFDNKAWFERSIFINWTCGIADCKYCYLSTKPKLKRDAVRSSASILAEILICQAMGWKIGYITGGLRVEKTEELVELMKKINIVMDKKITMNFGPYSRKEILAFKPVISGMGAAIESFDEELHNFICPSKPLKALIRTLTVLKEENIPSFITIILGLGEKKEDVDTVIEKVKEFNIQKVQLCFLKPQENTIFDEVPPPNPEYMAWWVAKLRIALPKLHIKVALVRERIADYEIMLKAGANSFSRFLVFNDFSTKYGEELEKACKSAKRSLEGNFTKLPEIDLKQLVPDHLEERELVLKKVEQYYQKLKNLEKA